MSVPYVCLIHPVCVCEAVTAGREGRLSTAPVSSELRRQETISAATGSAAAASFSGELGSSLSSPLKHQTLCTSRTHFSSRSEVKREGGEEKKEREKAAFSS